MLGLQIQRPATFLVLDRRRISRWRAAPKKPRVEAIGLQIMPLNAHARLYIPGYIEP